jgi:hypothetical protein
VSRVQAIVGNTVCVVGFMLCVIGNWLFLRRPNRGRPPGRLRRFVLRDAASTRDSDILRSHLAWLVAPGLVLMVLGQWLADF